MSGSSFNYQKEDHAAARTDDYVFNQLIPYIGNKRKLLGLVGRALALTGAAPSESTFLDLFAGSGVVSRMAKRMGFRVVANDWEPYAQEINRCHVACNAPPPFAAFGGYEAALRRLNELPPAVSWVTRHLCPADDDNYDTNRERMFYTRANGMRIDAARAEIDRWERDGLLDADERACLLAPMLYAASYTSNTSGVFKGFHRGWGGQTGTALYRIRSEFRLRPAVFYDNARRNEARRTDAAELTREARARGETFDVAYLDPPYNQHPYGSNYHVLNSVSLWDQPPLTEKIEGRNKSAIRTDWRTERRSAYNHRGTAERAYVELLANVPARHVLTSYSTDGMIPLDKLIEANVSAGHTEVVLQCYKRYRVSSQRYSHKSVNVEFILVTDTTRRHAGPRTDNLRQMILRAEETALDSHSEAAKPQTDSSMLLRA